MWCASPPTSRTAWRSPADRGCRRPKGSAFGIRDLLKKVDQNFFAGECSTWNIRPCFFCTECLPPQGGSRPYRMRRMRESPALCAVPPIGPKCSTWNSDSCLCGTASLPPAGEGAPKGRMRGSLTLFLCAPSSAEQGKPSLRPLRGFAHLLECSTWNISPSFCADLAGFLAGLLVSICRAVCYNSKRAPRAPISHTGRRTV